VVSLLPLGVPAVPHAARLAALLAVALAAAALGAARPPPAQTTPAAPPAGTAPAGTAPPGTAIGATPTPDRLAPPPTVANPNQADTGAQLFWLNCQPCHGDRGQGLTDEWRAQYPPEDRNCWDSGCHGERPYESGFRLPRAVPALVGPGALARFPSAATLHAYVSAAMPFQAPGSLSSDEYWAITAWLARQHGIDESRLPLGPDNAAGVLVGTAAGAATAQAPPGVPPAGPGGLPAAWLAALAALGAVVAGALALLARRARRGRA
jgi:cytochrome c